MPHLNPPLSPLLLASWNYELNGDLTPELARSNYTQNAWWDCLINPRHNSWRAQIKSRVNGKGCPVCANRVVQQYINDFPTTHPSIAAKWHPTKNGDLLPTQITYGYTKPVWFQDHGHEWRRTPYSQVRNDTCAICTGKQVQISINDLPTTDPEIAAEWHPTKNGKLKPEQFSRGMRVEVWWDSKICGHEWEAFIYHRTGGSGCPICGHTFIDPTVNSLAVTHPEIATELHSTLNHGVLATQISKGHDTALAWECKKCDHVWWARPADRTQGTGCPRCALGGVSGVEREMAAFVRGLGYPIEVSNRVLLGGKEVDIYLPEQKLAIEFNGLHWHSEAAGKLPEAHHEKWHRLKMQGIRLLQFWEDDWKHQRTTVENMIRNAISEEHSMDMQHLVGVQISLAEASAFFAQHSLQNVVSDATYFGVQLNGEIVAVLGLPTTGGFTITNFAAISTNPRLLSTILADVAHTHGAVAISYIADHLLDDDAVFESNGFVAVEELPLGYSYFFSHKKLDKAMFEQANPPGSKPRIWDAGRTRWVKTL